jgi:endonuclease/exonuclease/phosphatase family metal-dependent hydrolase
LASGWAGALDAADTFTVASYNVENYVDGLGGSRPAKSAVSRAKVRESIRALRPDTLALQEMGSTNTLLELRAALKAEGLDYPFWVHVAGLDTNLHVAVLSRFPFIEFHPHTNVSFLLNGRRFRVSRGFAELTLRVNPSYRFTLITAHLKSRRPIPTADEAELREQEALCLRAIVDARLAASPHPNIVVLGDFNDVKDSRSTRAIIGRGKTALIDTRPSERNGHGRGNNNARFAPRRITWTYYFAKEDTYSRIDYIMLSPGMAREWDPGGTCVLATPDWGMASDHRPIVAQFFAQDR